MVINDKYVFFLKEWPSQWKLAKMRVHGIEYNCCEQYMMHQKAMTFGDYDAATKIMAEPTPKGQKELGRQVRNYDDSVWSNVRYGVVLTGNLAKFMQNEDLRIKLLNTGYREFVEANPRDPIWGIGMDENDPNVNDESRWGQNLLGKVLTEVKYNIIRSLDGKIY